MYWLIAAAFYWALCGVGSIWLWAEDEDVYLLWATFLMAVGGVVMPMYLVWYGFEKSEGVLVLKSRSAEK